MRWRWNPRPAIGGLALLLAAAPVSGEESPAEVPPAGEAPPEQAPPVALEKLFELPPGMDAPTVRYGGATRSEWRARFDEARAKRAEAQAALEKAQQELGEIAAETDHWQMSAPGLGGLKAGGDQGPLSYRLNQEIRRQREEIARADRALQELRVEANLAGVPRDWIEPEPGPPHATPASTGAAE